MDKLNLGIVRTVTLLNDEGFRTCDSGDGETHDYECDRDVGYVVIVTNTDDMVLDSQKVLKLLEARGMVFDPAEDKFLSVSYSPVDGIAVIDIHNIHDRMLNFD